jgi:uncharacterized C2H2 Zn-finger protein
MIDTLVKSLGSLVRERRILQRKGQQLAQRQHQLVKGLGRLLQGIGYQLTPIRGGKAQSPQSNGAVKVGRRKHLKCPKCDRRFAHPLPLSRHLSASHAPTSKRTARQRKRAS